MSEQKFLDLRLSHPIPHGEFDAWAYLDALRRLLNCYTDNQERKDVITDKICEVYNLIYDEIMPPVEREEEKPAKLSDEIADIHSITIVRQYCKSVPELDYILSQYPDDDFVFQFHNFKRTWRVKGPEFTSEWRVTPEDALKMYFFRLK